MDILGFLLGLAGVLAAVIALLVESWLAVSIARRVLGVPVGLPRAFVVGLAMTISLVFSVQYLFRAGHGENQGGLNTAPGIAIMLSVLVLFWTFAFGITILVGLEIAFPTGTVPSPVAFVRGWRDNRRRGKRYTEVLGIAARHGLASQLRGLRRRDPASVDVLTPRALRESLNEAGVTFIKLGQMLSTRRDLLPEPYIRELSKLQTGASPEPWEVIKEALENDLPHPIDQVFARLDKAPLASASVAQVHAATLLDGTDVVVKIQRPGAVEQVRRDSDVILHLAQWLGRTAPWAKALGVPTLARGFVDSLDEELDYTIEAENMVTISGALAGSAYAVKVPRIYSEFSGPRVLVMERLPGVPLGDAREILSTLAPQQRKDMAEQLLGATLHQLVSAGVFHADLHPGNIFVNSDGSLALLDFGAVGRLDPSARNTLGMLLFAIDSNDAVGATDALVELLDRPEQLDERALERAVGQLLARFRTGYSAGGSQQMFTSMFSVVINFGFAVPPSIAAAFRALAALEGTLGLVSAEVDMVTYARAEGRRIMEAELKGKNLKDELEYRALTLLPMLNRLPRRLNRITEDLEAGRFSINVRMLADQRDRSFLASLVQQLIVAVLAGAAALGAIMLLTSSNGPRLTGDLTLYGFFGYLLLFAGFVLSLRAVALIFRRDSLHGRGDVSHIYK